MKIAISPSPENAGSINTFGRKMMHVLFESRSAAIRKKKKKKKNTHTHTKFYSVHPRFFSSINVGILKQFVFIASSKKKKEKKPIKSGKRPRSGLEACVRKKRQSKAKRNGNNVQDVDNLMNTDTLLEYNSLPVQLYSLPAQLYPSSAQLSNSEAYQVRSYPNDGSSLSLQKSQELTHVVNPIINEQSNFAQYSEIDQQSEISLTKLLQAQEQLMMPQGFNRVHYDLTSESQGSRDGRMW